MPDERNENNGRGERAAPCIRVLLQPEESFVDVPRAKAKNVAQLLAFLGLRQGTAIVASEGVLLTPDLPLYPGQAVLVRKVMSSG